MTLNLKAKTTKAETPAETARRWMEEGRPVEQVAHLMRFRAMVELASGWLTVDGELVWIA